MEDLKKIIAGFAREGCKGAGADLDANEYTGETLEIHKQGGDVFREKSLITFFIRGRTCWDNRLVRSEIVIHDLIRDCILKRIPGYEHLSAGDEQGREMLAGMLTEEVRRLMRENPEDFRITPVTPREEFADQETEDFLSCRDLA